MAEPAADRRGPTAHRVSDEPMPAERSTSDDGPMIAETYRELFAAWAKSDYIPDAPEGDEPTRLQKLGFWIVIAGIPLAIVSITAQSIRISGEYPAVDVMSSVVALLAVLIALALVLPPLADRLFGIRRVMAIEETDGGEQANG